MAHVQGPKTRSNGTTYFEVHYRNPDRQHRSKRFEKKALAEKWAKRLDTEMDDGIAPLERKATQRSFAEYANAWWETTVDVRPSTRTRTRGILDNYLILVFGKRAVKQLARHDIQAYINSLSHSGPTARTRGGCEPRSIKKVLDILKMVLAYALEEGAIRTNPALKVKLPTPEDSEQQWLNAEQIATLVACTPEHYQPLIEFAAYSGLRWGELAALHAADLNTTSGELRVKRSLVEVKVNGALRLVEGKPKTRRSTRTLVVPRFLCEQHANRESDALLFTTERGQQLRHSNFYGKVWRPAVQRAQAADSNFPPGLHFHSLRHTYAALLIDQGEHPKTISQWMGHASIGVTMDTYGHLMPERAVGIAERLDATHRRASLPADAASVVPLHRDSA